MVRKKKSQKYPIKASDWIIFLENESNSDLSMIIFIATVFLVGIIGLVQIYKDYTFDPLATLIIVFLLLLFFYLILMQLGKRASHVQDLIDDIIEGNISDPKEIRKRWLNDIKPKQRKLKK